MKILRILSLAAAAAGLLTLGACKSRDTHDHGSSVVQPQPVIGGTYINDDK